MLDESFPATFEAWEDGRIAGGRVAMIMEQGLPLKDAQARAEFEAEALTRAEGTTPGRLGASLARLAESLQPRPLAERHKFTGAVDGASGTGVPDDIRSLLPRTLVLAHLLLALFWVYDSSEGQRRTRRLLERGLRLFGTLLPLTRLPVLRGAQRDSLALVNEVRA